MQTTQPAGKHCSSAVWGTGGGVGVGGLVFSLSAAAVISRNTSFLMDSPVFVCAVV